MRIEHKMNTQLLVGKLNLHKVALTFIVLAGLCFNHAAMAGKKGDFEYSFIIPYTEDIDIEFAGGAQANIQGDIGFGFGISNFYSDQLVTKVDFTWNSSSYSAQRVLDDGNGTRESYSGSFNSFSLLFGGDYYITQSKISPFVSLNIGYSYIDSNIPSSTPASTCWWDAWYGYVCNTYTPTYDSDTWFYGGGLGIRLDVGDSHFVKIGYYEEWIDIDGSVGNTSFNTIRLEIGGKIM